jgi:serine phosphatase RsbU (regulator of sigma subunit)
MTTTATEPAATEHAATMQCMEVWGGNDPVDRGVSLPGLDAWVLSRPHGQSRAGGDIHYVSSCATGRVTRLLVADVSGHGKAVSATARHLRDLMRRYVNYLDQTAFVRALNREFSGLAQNGTFASSVVATFFAPTRDLAVCNAGHPAPLLWRAATGEWSLLQRTHHGPRPPHHPQGPSNLALGVLDVASYEQLDVTLAPGDVVVCYTDALVETRDAAGGLLGEAGLLEVVRGLGGRAESTATPHVLVRALLSELLRRDSAFLERDDVTILIFRANGQGERTPWPRRLLAPLRVAREVLGAPFRHRPAPFPEVSVPNIGGAIFHPLNKLRRRRSS